MILMHYRFTLPADYPMEIIEQRIRLSGARLDGCPGLIAKAFLYARLDDDELAVTENRYAPLYLWQDVPSMQHFLQSAGFQKLVSDFGWPALAGGAGIGVIQALIRQRYIYAAATLMALFSTGIMAGAALMAASAEPLFSLIGLQPALAVAGGLAVITLIIWLSGHHHRPANLATPVAVALPASRMLLLVVLALLLAGLLCLVVSPSAMLVVSTLLLGMGIGALFPLSLIVTLDHARSASEAGVLLSRVQGGGYLIAAVMPLVAGWVRDSGALLTSTWRFRPLTGSAINVRR